MKIFAHRGSHGPEGAFENTMAAFEQALAEGVDGIELDVRLSGDGVPVVFHDADLSRVTQGRDLRRVEHLSARELAAVPLPRGGHAPRLSEVMELLDGRCWVNIELKQSRCVEPVADLARRWEGLLLSSFDLRALERLGRRAPHLRRALIMGTETLDLAVRFREAFPFWTLRRLGVQAWHPHHALVSAPLVKACHRFGWAVRVWTVDDLPVAQRMREIGVDAVLADGPGALRAQLGS